MVNTDKNPDRLEESKTEFQFLQQAYEVLSNPQERAWYDEHRHAVLRGGMPNAPFCLSKGKSQQSTPDVASTH